LLQWTLFLSLILQFLPSDIWKQCAKQFHSSGTPLPHGPSAQSNICMYTPAWVFNNFKRDTNLACEVSLTEYGSSCVNFCGLQLSSLKFQVVFLLLTNCMQMDFSASFNAWFVCLSDVFFIEVGLLLHDEALPLYIHLVIYVQVWVQPCTKKQILNFKCWSHILFSVF